MHTRSRSFAALVLSTALAVGLAACSSGEVEVPAVVSEDACPDFSWQELSVSWQPAETASTGFRSVCIDENDAVTVSLPVEEPSLPTTLVDATGERVEVTSTERVLALDISGSLASTVYALGASEQLVGRDSATSEAALQSLPVVTAENHILNAEAILATRPDLILTDGTIGPRRVLDQLRNAGVAVVMVEQSQGIAANAARINLVSQALGIPEAGQLLSETIDQEVERIRSHISDNTTGLTKPRVAFLYVRGSAQVYYLLGEQSGVSDLIEAAGGIDVAREQGIADSVPLTSEALLAIQPDVIMAMTSGWESVGGTQGLLETLPQLAGVTALEKDNVVVVPDEYVVRFTTYSPATVMSVASALFGTRT